MLRRRHTLTVLARAFLKRMCGRKREKVTRVWRQLHNEELSNLCFSDVLIVVICSRMELMGEICRREKKISYSFSKKKGFSERNHFEDISRD